MTYTADRFIHDISRIEHSDTSHRWITVVNPINRRTLLQACDDCGVVKSENSIERGCKAAKGAAVISQSLLRSQKIAV